MKNYTYRIAAPDDLERIWAKNIAKNPEEPAWLRWREQYIGYNRNGDAVTFVVVCDGEPVGEGTLLFSPDCSAIRGRRNLADGKRVTNLNALRIEKEHEGQGHISRMVRMMEEYAKEHGYDRITIGVEAAETRNLGIYLHWHYDEFVMADVEDDTLVLYYAKNLAGDPE
ncbi:MAG: GNAT family N-acetyltransferase [Clostridia bacterium]|nr:GNAT family N-acetyltransferase [Oscillospiraceae bacterium]MBO4932989.1 GNAT family N-acetyltransferase [Clostridia bacterium]MBO5256446.1 GNAT family N-acetyltransferase [Clostridia bacterium]